jgi:tetraacyldisaccharide 4'-kinase
VRILLYPFSLVYGFIVLIRNGLFHFGLLKSRTFPIPLIGIGNLRVGGTGKTPMTEYVTRQLSPDFQLAVLSRGYGRKTKGFILADSNMNSLEIGDEPSQILNKYKNVQVAVDADRVNGVKRLLEVKPEVEIILLDDVFQHRSIKPGLMILLTAFNDLYIDDLLLPAGRLREQKFGAKRADIIVVTKCPSDISVFDMRSIAQRLNPESYQNLLFSSEHYGTPYAITKTNLTSINESKIYLMTGIANASGLFEYLNATNEIISHFDAGDHYWFTESDFNEAADLISDSGVIVTTEKDAQRIIPYLDQPLISKLPIFVIPVETNFLGSYSTQINQLIHDFIRSYSRNS